jgi:hypothetical protein
LGQHLPRTSIDHLDNDAAALAIQLKEQLILLPEHLRRVQRSNGLNNIMLFRNALQGSHGGRYGQWLHAASYRTDIHNNSFGSTSPYLGYDGVLKMHIGYPGADQ